METMTENKHYSKKRGLKPCLNFCHVGLTDQLFLTPTFSTSQSVTGNTNRQHQNYSMDILSLTKCWPEMTSSIPNVTIYKDQQQEIINVRFCSQLTPKSLYLFILFSLSPTSKIPHDNHKHKTFEIKIKSHHFCFLSQCKITNLSELNWDESL